MCRTGVAVIIFPYNLLPHPHTLTPSHPHSIGPKGTAICVYTAGNGVESNNGFSSGIFDIFREDVQRLDPVTGQTVETQNTFLEVSFIIKRIPSERSSQGERNGANFSFVAPSSEE